MKIKPTDLIATEEASQGFYPTPAALADKMLAGVRCDMIQNVLEPSAGKGDLVDAVLRKWPTYNNSVNIDICEIDPSLRAVCKYNFCGGRYEDVLKRFRSLDDMLAADRTEAQEAERKLLRRDLDRLRYADVNIVHDDFLTYRTCKPYQLILMNPPFVTGDRHLLHAIEMQKEGGSIICLLNAETVRNPYTQTRQVLVQKLQELGAEVEYIEDAFSNAERPARVDVAIVRICIEQPEAEESGIWERMKKAVEEESVPDEELHALVTGDYIEQAIQLYKTEVAATLELVREYRRLSPYMTRKLGAKNTFDRQPILTLTVGDDNYIHGFDVNKYMRTVRMKYWEVLFENREFTGRLTSELQKTYRGTVEKMADYEFSAFNIKQILVEMNASMIQGVEKAILDLFEKLTVEHSWYPECSGNRHYFNGWATNKAHKIGKKCIIPTCGMFSSYSWHKETFEVSAAYGVISDIEKAFDYLDGGRTDEVDLQFRLRTACDAGQTRNIPCKYFKVDLFKKGTTHIKFYPEAMPLVERLNIYASQKKGWLPPSYGRAAYTAMEADEKAVVDSFHGDGSDGSGQQNYETVMQNAAFFLAEPTQQLPALMAPGA